MKNFRFRFIFLLSLILFAIKLNAQDEFRLAINSTFQNVDKTQIPTKYLKEVGYPFLDLNAFNGILNDSGVIDITGWRKLYASFISSYVGTGTPTFPDLSAANTNIVSYESSGSIPVSLLYVNYNDLRPDAVTAGLLTTSNNQIFDVAGRSSSPYRSQTCFAAVTGKYIWRVIINGNFLFSGFIIQNGRVYANDSYGNLHCIDAVTSKEYWVEPTSGTSSDMVYLDGVVYLVGGGDGLLHAVDAETGTTLWKVKSPDATTYNDGYFDRFCAAVPGSFGSKGRIIVSTGYNAYCYEAAK